jgi:chromosome partitioning protein
MTEENSPSARVVVVANEKGGSGKSTVAINLAIALLRAGNSVATIDVDSRQRSLTHYVDNRIIWSRETGRELSVPTHICFDEEGEFQSGDEVAGRESFAGTFENLAASHRYVIIDMPGHAHYLTALIHSLADTLITPLNDSFVDLDVLGSVDPKTYEVSSTGHYADIVANGRATRIGGELDWIVLRNRLSTTRNRNKQLVGAALTELSRKLGFRMTDGLAERTIFREFYPRGLTAMDELDRETLGVRPTISHLTAALEMQSLLRAVLRLPPIAPLGEEEANTQDRAHAQAA